MSRLFASGGQNIAASASAWVLPMNTQGWFPLGLIGLISLLFKGLKESSPATHLESINSSVLSRLYGPTLTSIHDYKKNHSFDYTDLCWQSWCLYFLIYSLVFVCICFLQEQITFNEVRRDSNQISELLHWPKKRVSIYRHICGNLLFFFFNLFNWRLITLQYCSGFSHTLTWISHGFTYVPHSKSPSHLPPQPIPLGHHSTPALSTLSHASNLDWQSLPHMIIYMCQCYSLKSSHPFFSPQSPKVCVYISVYFAVSHIGSSLPCF